MHQYRHRRILQVFVCFLFAFTLFHVSAQPGSANIKWGPDGKSFYRSKGGEIFLVSLPENKETVVVKKEQLIPSGESKPLTIKNYSFSDDAQLLLIYTNAKKVWRYETRGDYWVLNLKTNALKQLGKGLPGSSLMFAKFSPDGKQAAYVSAHNIYLENIESGEIKPLTTTNGTKKLINGTFDWVYEEELDCRDGFRWSPDGKSIAYWQIDANQVRDYLMLNTTDSIYSFVVPVEYPKVGEPPSPYKIGVINIAAGSTKWMNIPGDPRQTYLPRMEWAANSTELVIQQLNRKQIESKIYSCNAASGETTEIQDEKDNAFIDVKGRWQDGEIAGWDWLNGGKEFLWVSEKDGWRHLFRISRDGKKETLITKGEYDLIKIELVDEKNNLVYFMASPENATQEYLYKTRLDGKGKAERVSPADQQGTHGYNLSPNGAFAFHAFSNANVQHSREWITLPDHKPIPGMGSVAEKIAAAKDKKKVEFFKITTADGVTMDGWMVKPNNFDSTKKYPVVFYVYTEPAGQTVKDSWGSGLNSLYQGDMAADGYVYMSLDGRGTPAPKGSAWRKSIYRQVGRMNIRDQAMATKEILKWPWIDSSRIAVWGWSGGGSTTLNLLFQYPEIYKTGIAIAAVGNQLSYDNIYQERYMGLPQENMDDFIQGSPITYAKNLKGNLLYIHGTGDDNVHYQNAELLINALIKNNKVFQLMSYPNRTHGIFEGEGTSLHLAHLYTDYLKKNCPGGAH